MEVFVILPIFKQVVGMDIVAIEGLVYLM